jgi:hypothetical protein
MLAETEKNASMAGNPTPPPMTIDLVVNGLAPEEPEKSIPQSEQSAVAENTVAENTVAENSAESSSDAENIASARCAGRTMWRVVRILLEIVILGAMFFLTFFSGRGQLVCILLGLLVVAFIGLLLLSKKAGSSATPQNSGIIELSDGTKVRQSKSNPKIYTDLNSNRKFIRNGNDFLEM